MSSGGGKNSTTVQKSDPPAWAVPYFQQGLGMASQVANQPYQQYGGPRVYGFTPDQQRAMQMVRDQAGQGQGGYQPGLDQINKTLQQGGGKNPYSGANPYLGRMIGNAQRDVVQSYKQGALPNMMAQFNAGGAFGGTAHQQALANSQQALAGELGDISTSMRSQDYNRQTGLAESRLDRDLGARQSAMGMLPGYLQAMQSAGYQDASQLGKMGSLQQQLGQQVFDTGYDNFTEQRDWQMNRLGALANMLGTVQGGTASQTGANPNYRSAGQNALTAALVAASLWGGS